MKKQQVLKVVELVEFLASDVGKHLVKASVGKLTEDEISALSEDEMRLALLLIRFRTYLEDDVKRDLCRTSGTDSD